MINHQRFSGNMTNGLSTPDRPIRVLLADDQALVRAGFRVLLEVQPDIVVAGDAGDGAEAAAFARAHQPDVVLMDIRMPVMDGIAATRQIVATPGLERVRVLILTTYDTDEYVYEALRVGASGFLLKDSGPAELLHGIRVVAAGDALLSPRITRRLISRFVDAARPPGPDRRLARLTQRELEIVKLVGQGMSNDEIAGVLCLSPATARTHVSRAMRKLDVRDRAQLVVFAYQSRLVEPV